MFSAPCEARKFRFAVALGGSTWDFGKNFYANGARINLQTRLSAMYPDVDTDNVFAVINEDFSKQCNPQILAWLNSGVNLIIGMLGHQPCFLGVASSWPNVTFAVYLGTAAGPPNFVNLQIRVYQPLFLAGYLAGLTTKTKKVCISSNVRQPSPVVFVTAFARGVRSADPSVEIHIMETGQIVNPLLEVWNVNQSYAMGCDVVYVQSVAIDGCIQAQNLQMMSIALFSDARRTVGEYVITSAVVDPTPMFYRVGEAVMNGTLLNETKKPDWWMGWNGGAMALGDPSFLVPPNVTAQVLAQKATLNQVFCGRTCTKATCLCTNASCCVSDAQLNALVAFPDFVTEHGVLQLPGRACKAGQLATWRIDTFTMTCTDCPAGTYAYNVDQVSECRPCPAASYSSAASTSCIACPAGTYNDQLQQGQCTPCPAGSIAANPGAARCNACPSGLSSSDGTECGSASLTWLAGVGGGVAFILLLVGLWAWWASRKMRAMRKQFSNDNVAVECAAAIARLDLQAVAWLNDIPKPNCIQLSFIRIVKILDEVRKFVPDQLLQSLASGKDSDAEEQEGTPAEELDDSVSLPTSPQTSVKDGQPPWTRAPLMRSAHKSSRSLTQRSSVASTSRAPQGLLAVRKVTYLLVQFHMNQHQPTVNQAESTLKAFMSHLVEQTKAHGGTLG
eukprot:EG_transcript_5653